MADFKQAVEWAFDNKVHTGEGYYLVLEKGKLVFRDKETNVLWRTQELTITHINTTAWEIYKEEDKLSKEDEETIIDIIKAKIDKATPEEITEVSEYLDSLNK